MVSASRGVASATMTPKQQLFALEYLKDQNGTQAAIRAGYAAAGAHVTASRLLREPKIAKFLAEKQAATLEKFEISTERILRERARLAFFDPRKLFDKDGRPKGIHELDDETAAVIQGFDCEEIWGPGGKRQEQPDLFDGADAEGDRPVRLPIGMIRKVKLADKAASLTALEKIHGMYRETDTGEGALNIHIHL